MTPLTLERTRRIAAPADRLWQAITEPEQLAQWLLPPGMGASMKRDADGTLSTVMGPMAIPMAVLEVVEPGRQVALRGLPDRLLVTTLTLDPDTDGAQVTAVMRGFEVLPEAAAQERLGPSGLGWERALENLEAHATGQAVPHPQGHVAAMLGYRRQNASKYSIERSIWINAPRERVWQAITDPALIQQWFSPGTEWKSSGQGVGSRIYVVNPENGAEMYTQVTEAFDPPSRLMTRSVPEGPEQPDVTEWTLTEENGGTRLTLTYSSDKPDADALYAHLEQSAFGFGMMLDNVKAVAEGAQVPYPMGF